MHFARTEEQDELAAVVRDLLDKRSGSEAVRSAMESEAGYDESLWQAMCEQVGVAALPVPEEYDGFGASLVETAIVLEELGRNLAPSPLLATAIATGAVLAHADKMARHDLLPAICAGTVATLVLDDLVLDPTAELVLRLDDGRLERLDDADRRGRRARWTRPSGSAASPARGPPSARSRTRGRCWTSRGR